MQKGCLLQVFAMILIAFFVSTEPGRAEESPKPTPRQVEILAVLNASRPPWEPEGGCWMLAEWDVAFGLAAVAPPPSKSGNAGAAFKRAEACYQTEKELLAAGGPGECGVAALLEAGEVRDCRLVPEHYPEFDSLEAKQPDFIVLRLYLDALLRKAENAAEEGDSEEAERCFRAGLICGLHLMRDKSGSVVFATGLLFAMHSASSYQAYLAKAGKREDLELLREYISRVGTMFRAYTWKSTVALGETENFACLPAVIRIATEDKEPFWRKEAVLRLARLRYGVPGNDGSVLRNPGYEAAADAALSRVAAQDPDPSVRRLAVWAAGNLGLDDYESRAHRYMSE